MTVGDKKLFLCQPKITLPEIWSVIVHESGFWGRQLSTPFPGIQIPQLHGASQQKGLLPDVQWA